MHQSLQPKTVDQHTQPYKLMYNLLDPKGQLLIVTLIVISVCVDIDEGEEYVFIGEDIAADYYWTDFEQDD